MEKVIFGNTDRVITLYDPVKHERALQEFCNKCADLGWENNKSFHALKLNQIIGEWWIAIEKSSNTIFNVAGIQYLPQISENAWRLLFRGAQLPGYTPNNNTNVWKSGIQFSYFINEQIHWALENANQPQFFVTTNSVNTRAGKSIRLGRSMAPKLAKAGYLTLYKSEMNLYSTIQDIWKLDSEKYLHDREKFLPNN